MGNSNNKYYQTLLFLLSFCIIHSTLCIATVRFVSHTGNSTPPYLTWETAADSIQECINICVFGDTIYVANGVYQEIINMVPGLSLIGAGIDSCSIDTRAFITATNHRSVIVNDNCIFKGFTVIIANNTNIGGGTAGTAINSLITENRFTKALYGITNGSNVIIYKNIIDHISIGIDLVNSNALVRNNSISTDANSGAAIIAGIQIAAFGNESPIIDSNYIFDHFYGIVKDLGSSPIIKNNIIMKRGGYGIRSGIGGTSKIFNNIIFAETGYEGIYGNGSYRKVINNYVTGNFSSYGISHTASYDSIKNNVVTNAGGGISSWNSQNLIVEFNNLWNNDINYYGFTPDTTNLSVDPMVVNDDTTQGELDFRLQMYSPLIDAGDPTILDRDGSRSDIGLYGGPYGWTYTYNDLAPRPPHNVTATIEEGLVKLTWNKNTEADFSHYRIYRDTVTIVIYDSTKMIAETPDTFYYDQLPPVNHETRFYYVITAFDNQGNQSYPSEEINVLVTGLGEHPPKGYDGYRLLANYPNPFNPSTKIPYRLKERGHVRLSIYDLKGELVRILVNEWQERGYYVVVFQPNAEDKSKITKFEVMMGKTYSHMSSGMYIYSIQVIDERNIPVFTDSEKMILLK
jgi:hypothetical protein